MIKLSDYVFEYLKSKGIDTVFTLTGGGIMHLVESMANCGMEYVCCHHEQACSIAAQAYGMYREKLCVCLVTTGPGGTNALTGLAAAYVDSTPVLFISGQVKREDYASLRGVRQFGAQENDILSMARPVCKYAETVQEPEDILYHLQRALKAATSGRKGPVWLDIPLDVQAAMIEESGLREYVEEQISEEAGCRQKMAEDAAYTLKCLEESHRPVILAGQGAVSAGVLEDVEAFARKHRIPILTTWRATWMLDWNDELNFGSPGLQASRYSNLILQSCDFLLVLGSRVDNMITAFNEEHFAYQAKKVIVDIDTMEIKKLRMTQVHAVTGDVGAFMKTLNQMDSGAGRAAGSDWLRACSEIRDKYPIQGEVQKIEAGINLYRAAEAISDFCTGEDTIVISSTSRCNTAGHIAFRHRKGQRTISSMGMGSMGFALPSAVGAYYAGGKNRVIVLEGDGSFQLNIQELQTICHYGVNAKIFIFNNSGYAAIKQMQDRNFAGHHVGSTPDSGVDMPDFGRIANAYGISYFKVEKGEELEETVRRVMEQQGPVICDLTGSLDFDEIPKCISAVDEKTGRRVSAYLENPYPFRTEEMQGVMDRLSKI